MPNEVTTPTLKTREMLRGMDAEDCFPKHLVGELLRVDGFGHLDLEEAIAPRDW